MRQLQKEITNAVHEHYAPHVSKRIQRLGSLAFWDLYYGPLDGCDECGANRLSECSCDVKWPGFSQACDELKAWCDEHVTDMFYDGQTGMLIDTLDEEMLDELLMLSAREVKSYLFDKEVAKYL